MARLMKKAGYEGMDELAGGAYLNEESMAKLWKRQPLQILPIWPDVLDNPYDLFVPSDHPDAERNAPKMRNGSAHLYPTKALWRRVQGLRAKFVEWAGDRTLIVPTGRLALWALMPEAALMKSRGWTTRTRDGLVVLPTLDARAVMANWKLRTTVVLDLGKARKEWLSGGIPERERTIWTEPSIEDLYDWWRTYGKGASMLGVDIETDSMQISEIGFAAGDHALHVPFFWKEGKGDKMRVHEWWPDAETEARAWEFVRMVLASDVPKIGQNFKYDAYWILEELGFPILNWRADTMVAAHCWQPELKRDLNTLAANFLHSARSWKTLRSFRKRDEE